MNIRYFFVVLIALMGTTLYPVEQDPLNEVEIAETELIVLLDDQIRAMCNELLDIRRQSERSIDEELALLTDPDLQDVDYTTVLRALYRCIEPGEQPRSNHEQTVQKKLRHIYEQLMDEYDDLIAQMSTRRIKCKYFCKVTTRDLIVNNNACVSTLIVKDGVTIDRLNGALVATDGRISTGEIPASAIPDDAITNDKLAPNAVNSNNIVPMTITSEDTAFNPVVATSGEARPLVVYRGTVAANGGPVANSGQNFSSSRSGFGPFTYTIKLNAINYESIDAYQVFIQLPDETAADVTAVTKTSNDEISVTTSAATKLSFFTIGQQETTV